MQVPCTACGTLVEAPQHRAHFRCHACHLARADQIRVLAGEGLSQPQIGQRLGITRAAVATICAAYSIRTAGSHPALQGRTVHGVGKKPTQLMPSVKALKASSVFRFAHGSQSSFFLPT